MHRCEHCSVPSEPDGSHLIAVGPEISWPKSQSLAQRCSLDELLCVLAFAYEENIRHTTKENFPSVCRQWNRAAQKQKNRAVRLVDWLQSSSNYNHREFMLHSPMRRHVAAISVEIFDVGQLDALQKDWPSLTALHIKTSSLSDIFQKEKCKLPVYPPGLAELELNVTHCAALEDVQLLIDALASAPHLTSCHVGWCPHREQLELEPLLLLKSLKKLVWGIVDLNTQEAQFTVRQLATVKQIASLQQLICERGDWSAEEVQLFCSEPTLLQRLTTLSLRHTEMNYESMLALCNLPSLTQLSVLRIRPEAYPLLTRLTQLSSLELSLNYPEPTLTILQVFCSSLRSSSFTALSVWQLKNQSLMSDLMMLLHSLLPGMKRFQFHHCAVMHCMDKLSHFKSLEELHLRSCTPVLDGVDQIGLAFSPALRSLHLFASVNLSVAEESLFKPPSQLIPTLERFSFWYVRPQADKLPQSPPPSV
jgi:hypothetical protein